MTKGKLEKLIDRAIRICWHMENFTVADVKREALSIDKRSGGEGLPAYVEGPNGSFISINVYIHTAVAIAIATAGSLAKAEAARRRRKKWRGK